MRIGIVNDLSLAREVLQRVVLSVPGHVVAWCAEDGDVAVAKAAADRPDVILMDLVMPRLNGVEATRQIMRQSPCPILVVTGSVASNYALACGAMGAGAVDAVETPALGPGGTIRNGEKLVDRLARLEASLGDAGPSPVAALPSGPPAAADGPPLVLLGASTGGPDALTQVLSRFPADFPAAVLVCQHIGADFALGLVQQLASATRLTVRAARTGHVPTAGTVHIAVSNDHLELGPDRVLRYNPNPHHLPYRPSIDVLYASAAAYARPGVAALLTGMMSDGAEGLLRLRTAGWHTIAQDEETSVVRNGMPFAAVARGAAVEVLPLPHIADGIVARVLTHKRRS
jgi:two-component system response regulator WspF